MWLWLRSKKRFLLTTSPTASAGDWLYTYGLAVRCTWIKKYGNRRKSTV